MVNRCRRRSFANPHRCLRRRPLELAGSDLGPIFLRFSRARRGANLFGDFGGARPWSVDRGRQSGAASDASSGRRCGMGNSRCQRECRDASRGLGPLRCSAIRTLVATSARSNDVGESRPCPSTSAIVRPDRTTPGSAFDSQSRKPFKRRRASWIQSGCSREYRRVSHRFPRRLPLLRGAADATIYSGQLVPWDNAERKGWDDAGVPRVLSDARG